MDNLNSKMYGSGLIKVKKISIIFIFIFLNILDTSYKLRNMNFKITPGENIAVLGKSGTGKSTLFNLILRLFEVDKTKDS